MLIQRWSHSSWERCLFKGEHILARYVYSQMNTFHLKVYMQSWTHSLRRCLFTGEHIISEEGIWLCKFTGEHLLYLGVYSQENTLNLEESIHKNTFYLDVSIHRCTHSISRCLFTGKLILSEEYVCSLKAHSIWKCYSQMNTTVLKCLFTDVHILSRGVYLHVNSF